MEEALKIYKILLENGELNRQQNKELFGTYLEKIEVKEILEKFEKELQFKIVDTPRTLYLVADIENKVLSYSLREVREFIRTDAKLIDAFLLCYIIMFILYLFYGGKNADPKQAEFLQIKDIIQMLDERFAKMDENTQRLLEEDYSINFTNISHEWNSKIVNGPERKTKYNTVKKACHLLENEKLIFFPQGEDAEIRPEEKLDNLMRYHYLLEDRVKGINKIFQMGGKENA